MRFSSYYLGSASEGRDVRTFVRSGCDPEVLEFAARYEGTDGFVVEMEPTSARVTRRWSRTEARACAALARSLGRAFQ